MHFEGWLLRELNQLPCTHLPCNTIRCYWSLTLWIRSSSSTVKRCNWMINSGGVLCSSAPCTAPCTSDPTDKGESSFITHGWGVHQQTWVSVACSSMHPAAEMCIWSLSCWSWPAELHYFCMYSHGSASDLTELWVRHTWQASFLCHWST